MRAQNEPYTIVKILNYLIIQPAAGADFLRHFSEIKNERQSYMIYNLPQAPIFWAFWKSLGGDALRKF